jgi:hypothetical protein
MTTIVSYLMDDERLWQVSRRQALANKVLLQALHGGCVR